MPFSKHATALLVGNLIYQIYKEGKGLLLCHYCWLILLK